METGQIGLHGVLALYLVEEEYKQTPGLVLILHQQMVGKIAVLQILKLQHKPAIISHVLLVIYRFQIFHNFHKN